MNQHIRKLTVLDISNVLAHLRKIDELEPLLQRLQLDEPILDEWLEQEIKVGNALMNSVEINRESLGVIALLPYNINPGTIELFIWFDYQTICAHHLLFRQLLRHILTTLIDQPVGNSLHISIHKKNPLILDIFNHLLGGTDQFTIEHTDDIHLNIPMAQLKIQPDLLPNHSTDIQYLEPYNENDIYIKRDDLIPFSFGGNKVRKAYYFFEEILRGNYQTVVTYGSRQSNHCRVIAAMCYKHGLECIIVSPHSHEATNTNQALIHLSGAQIITCPLDKVSITIEETIHSLKNKHNKKVYFIPGGGHNNHGTQAYVDAYHEIVSWEEEHQIEFDYLFLASGTGTTQAGLVIGQLLHHKVHTKIIGISIARAQEYGEQVIYDSIQDYLKSLTLDTGYNPAEYIHFYDNYIPVQYGKSNQQIKDTVTKLYNKHSIPTSTTYTAKAYSGMENYLTTHNIKNKNILFLHTGGIPLFFDDVKDLQ